MDPLGLESDVCSPTTLTFGLLGQPPFWKVAMLPLMSKVSGQWPGVKHRNDWVPASAFSQDRRTETFQHIPRGAN